MYKRLFLIIVFILAAPLFCKAEGISLTLDEAVTIALRDNRAVLLKAEDVKKAKYGISEAQAALFPSLTAGAGWSDTRGLYDKDVGVYTAQAGVKQILYAGGKVVNAIKVSEYSYESAQAVLDQTKQDTVYMVTRSFYTLLLAQKAAELIKQCLRIRRNMRRLSERAIAGDRRRHQTRSISNRLSAACSRSMKRACARQKQRRRSCGISCIWMPA